MSEREALPSNVNAHPWHELRDALKSSQFQVAFLFFYCLLFAYYLLRPVREEVGILQGVDNLQWLYTGTFVVMLLIVPLFGWLKNKLRRRTLVRTVYLFFSLNLMAFYVLFAEDLMSTWVARAFFIWLSVFNMFAVSVFWSLMADVYPRRKARSLFAPVAAAGSLGGISGSWITAQYVTDIGIRNLLLLAALLLVVVALCATRLLRYGDEHRAERAAATGNAAPDLAQEQANQGGILVGVTALANSPYLAKIAIISLLYTVIASLLYFIQQNLVAEFLSDSLVRTQFFARINLAINIAALCFQFFVTSWLVKRFGVSGTYSGSIIAVIAGVIVLGIWPAVATIAVAQIVLRAGQFGTMKPCYDMLFSAVSREQKYKSKNFIDTSLVRGGDLLGGWSFTGLKLAGLTVGGITAVTVVLLVALAGVAIKVGREFDEGSANSLTVRSAQSLQ
ncbi:MAG: NTP/NDP exchange transporter [Gammaproteobacteria bacterium]